MSRATLVDTNVLVYVEDARDTGRRAQAGSVLDQLIKAERAALSVQCLSEFFVTAIRLPEPLTKAEATEQVGRYIRVCEVLDLTAAVVLEAARGSAEHDMSIWDALIWAAAKMNGIPHVLTEDAEHGRFVEGVTYLNPFDPRFDIAPLVA